MIGIKNIDMPTSCYDCDFCVEDRSTEKTACFFNQGSDIGYLWHQRRREDCPLVMAVETDRIYFADLNYGDCFSADNNNNRYFIKIMDLKNSTETINAINLTSGNGWSFKPKAIVKKTNDIINTEK